MAMRVFLDALDFKLFGVDIQPEWGQLYKCRMIDKQVRILRFGYHRKNNDRNWSKPPAGQPLPSCLWIGWRDADNGRFVRPGEVVEFEALAGADDAGSPQRCTVWPPLCPASGGTSTSTHVRVSTLKTEFPVPENL